MKSLRDRLREAISHANPMQRGYALRKAMETVSLGDLLTDLEPFVEAVIDHDPPPDPMAELVALGHSEEVAAGLLRNAQTILAVGHAGDPDMPLNDHTAPKVTAILRAYAANLESRDFQFLQGKEVLRLLAEGPVDPPRHEKMVAFLTAELQVLNDLRREKASRWEALKAAVPTPTFTGVVDETLGSFKNDPSWLCSLQLSMTGQDGTAVVVSFKDIPPPMVDVLNDPKIAPGSRVEITIRNAAGDAVAPAGK